MFFEIGQLSSTVLIGFCLGLECGNFLAPSLNLHRTRGVLTPYRLATLRSHPRALAKLIHQSHRHRMQCWGEVSPVKDRVRLGWTYLTNLASLHLSTFPASSWAQAYYKPDQQRLRKWTSLRFQMDIQIWGTIL
jgi:hypothetical protein